ncbi:MAG: hypothetical protein M0P43_06390 [Arcobacteraceae bacterium]|nr:hypothetical protein [Arcobacteraceae bacterium]
MIWKVLVFIFILVLVYLVFFRKKRISNNSTNNNKKDEIADTLIECNTCGIYITKDESILSNGKYFCSKECMNK